MSDDRRESPSARGEVTVREPSRGEQLVARRAAESRATIPDTTVSTPIDVSNALAVAPAGVTVDDIVIAACARALREQPNVNGAYRDGRVETYARVNVGVVLETRDTLVAPTLFDADQLSLTELARRRAELVARAEAGALAAPELGGQTFTVLAVSEPVAVVPVVVPLHAAALAIGAPEPRASAVGGAALVRAVLDATLACDHRAITPPAAARFLSRVRELVEA